MKGMRIALLVAALLLASCAESTGPLLIVVAVGSGMAFALLLILASRSEAVGRAEVRGREITIFVPPPFPIEERAADAEIASCMMPRGWKSIEKPLQASGPRRNCRAP